MTTTAKRPTTARKHTRTTTAKADAELDNGVAFTDTDGARLQVRIRDVKGSHDVALVTATGYDFMGLLRAVSERQGLDLLSAVVWFVRLVNDRDAGTYEDTLASFGYADLLTLDMGEAEADDGRPKVSASNS